MRPPSFELMRPSSIPDAVCAVNESDAGMYYSGGTELLLAMKLRVIHAQRVVDIKNIPGLDRIALAGPGTIEIGARCTHRMIANDRIIRDRLPALSRLCANVANVRVRNAGTIGGNLCFGEPHADPPTLLAALDAQLFLIGSAGERVVSANDFITDEFETVRRPDELLRGIRISIPNGPVAYRRFRHGERPSVNVAVVWSLESDLRTIAHARVRVGALGPRPQSLERVEAILSGAPVAEASRLVETVLSDALDALDVTDDRHGSSDYKRHLAGVLLRRNIADAVTACRGSEQ